MQRFLPAERKMLLNRGDDQGKQDQEKKEVFGDSHSVRKAVQVQLAQLPHKSKEI